MITSIWIFYGNMKISIKSSYFRIKERPSFVVYGKRDVRETNKRSTRRTSENVLHA